MLRDPALIPLSHQHHNGLALCVLTARALVSDRSDAAISRLARRVIDRYEIELTNHFGIEEQLLFPLIERELGGMAMSDYIRREENELFQDIQQRLPKEALASAGIEIEARAIRVCL